VTSLERVEGHRRPDRIEFLDDDHEPASVLVQNNENDDDAKRGRWSAARHGAPKGVPFW
jgi:hypothetical protein